MKTCERSLRNPKWFGGLKTIFSAKLISGSHVIYWNRSRASPTPISCGRTRNILTVSATALLLNWWISSTELTPSAPRSCEHLQSYGITIVPGTSPLWLIRRPAWLPIGPCFSPPSRRTAEGCRRTFPATYFANFCGAIQVPTLAARFAISSERLLSTGSEIFR